MKKYLLLLSFALGIFAFAQNPILLSNSWAITELKVNNQTFQPTLNNSAIFNSNSAKIGYFNLLNSDIIYIAQNQFNIDNAFVTIVDSFDPSIAEFDLYYLENFWGTRNLNNLYYINPKNPFTYTISTDGNTLTINNVNGDIATYSKANLFTQNFKKSEPKIYPNPTSDFIYFENIKMNSSVKIIDVSGKVVLNTKLSGNSIDIKSLPKGNYFIVVEDGKPQKFIKK